MAQVIGSQAIGEAEEGARPDWLDFAHTGPGTLAGRYLRRFWQPIYRSQDLPTGRAVPVRLMSEDFTLFRGESGDPHLIAFRCAHRGTQLSTGWVEGDTLRCRYHGWAYDATGQCVSQPAEPEPFCSRVKVGGYPTQEYLGLIFVYIGEGEPPPLPRYIEVEGEGELTVSLSYRPCNWFNNMENSADEVHVAFTHRNAFGDYMDEIPLVSGEETAYGIRRYGQHPNGEVRVCHLFLPNTHHIGDSPEQQSFNWRVPIDDEMHAIPIISRRRTSEGQPHRSREGQSDPWETSERIRQVGDTVLAGKLHLDAVEDRANLVPIQDYVTQIGQGRIADREHERLGRSDAVIVLLRSIFARELQALAEGRPLKEWRRPDEPVYSLSGETVRA
jgi:5,5'-dehydrodivanillate O-demethylase